MRVFQIALKFGSLKLVKFHEFYDGFIQNNMYYIYRYLLLSPRLYSRKTICLIKHVIKMYEIISASGGTLL